MVARGFQWRGRHACPAPESCWMNGDAWRSMTISPTHSTSESIVLNRSWKRWLKWPAWWENSLGTPVSPPARPASSWLFEVIYFKLIKGLFLGLSSSFLPFTYRHTLFHLNQLAAGLATWKVAFPGSCPSIKPAQILISFTLVSLIAVTLNRSIN